MAVPTKRPVVEMTCRSKGPRQVDVGHSEMPLRRQRQAAQLLLGVMPIVGRRTQNTLQVAPMKEQAQPTTWHRRPHPWLVAHLEQGAQAGRADFLETTTSGSQLCTMMGRSLTFLASPPEF